MHYDLLIERARNRLLDGYVEVHHVIPRCMGGLDEADNLVQLTAEEHFVAHQLLCKMFPSVISLAFAAQVMTGSPHGNSARVGNKLFGWIKRRSIEARQFQSARVFSAKARANMAAARRKTWEDRRAAGTDLLIGQKTAETRRKNGSYEFTEQHKQNIGASSKGRPSPNKGKVTPDEVRMKQSKSALRRWHGSESVN